MLPTISNPTDGEPSLTALWAGFLITLLGLGGCSLDFDQFEGEPPPETIDMSAGDTRLPDMGPGADATMSDTDPDAPDMLPPGLVIGASCADDSGCPGGTCAGGYCTIGCADSSECPMGTSCRELDDIAGCVADCVDDACDGVAERDDLSCVYAVTTDGNYARSCLVDSDADTIPDVDDPCPDNPEGRATDTDSDGDGDACDAEPLCLPGHTDGIVDLGSVGSMTNEISVPHFVDGPVIPIWGGRDEMENVAAITYLDIRTGTFSDGGMLPRTGVQFASAPLNGGWLLTPGARAIDGQQVGRFLEIRTSGASTSLVVDELVYEPTLLTLESGGVFLHGYNEPGNDARWTIWRWNREIAQFQSIAAGAGGNRVKWGALRDGNGYGYFYSQGRDFTQRGYIVRVDGTTATSRSVNWPDTYMPFDPFIVAGNGGSLWAYEKSDGRAWTFTFDNLNVIRANDFDIQLNLENMHWVATGGPGFVIVGRQPMVADQWVARGYSLPCFANANALDRDGDTVPDVVDNCPDDANENQEGLGDDLLGNACDSDDDGDSIPDSAEITTDMDGNVTEDLSLDTDNDGENNDSDADLDGDGIPNVEDRWPFDTDNDRLPNELDRDDDDDGYSDTSEIAQTTNPLDRLSFPNGGRVVWIADGASRVLQSTTLEGDGTIIEVPVEGIASPHHPRLALSDHVLALDGPPDQATGVTFTELSDSATTTNYNFTAPIRGADIDPNGGVEPPTLFLVTENDAGVYELSLLFAADGLDARTVIFDEFDVVEGPHASGDGEVFIATPPGCTECNVLFRQRSMLEPFSFVDVQNPRKVGYSLGAMVFVADDVDGVERLYRLVGSEAREVETPMWERIDSVAPLRSGNHILVSAAMPGGSFDIWFYNGIKDRWEPFATSDDDLIELDWKP